MKRIRTSCNLEHGCLPLAGTQVSGLLDFNDPNTGLVQPEVAFSIPGCTGSEAMLLDCPANQTVNFPGQFDSRGCRAVTVQLTRSLAPAVPTPGLQLACVAAPEEGAYLPLLGEIAHVDIALPNFFI